MEHSFVFYKSLGGLELLLTLDSKVTQLLAVCSSTGNRFQRLLKTLFLTLEVSGHGLPWFLLCGVLLAGNLLTGEQYLWVYSFDLFAILVLDIVLVAPMKIFFRRPRPSVNTVNKGNVLFSVSTVDNYAFPSGHASRSVAVAAFFCYMPPFNSRTHLWYIWALSVSVSRIMMGRHHVLDVIVGTMAGLFVFEIVRQTCLLI